MSQDDDLGLPPGLREEYLQGARSQLGQLAKLAQRLSAAGNDREALATLQRETHKIHGSAGSYGFMDASRLAAGMEATVKDWVAHPEDAEVNRGSLTHWFVVRLAELLGLQVPLPQPDPARPMPRVGPPPRPSKPAPRPSVHIPRPAPPPAPPVPRPAPPPAPKPPPPPAPPARPAPPPTPPAPPAPPPATPRPTRPTRPTRPPAPVPPPPEEAGPGDLPWILTPQAVTEPPPAAAGRPPPPARHAPADATDAADPAAGAGTAASRGGGAREFALDPHAAGRHGTAACSGGPPPPPAHPHPHPHPEPRSGG